MKVIFVYLDTKYFVSLTILLSAMYGRFQFLSCILFLFIIFQTSSFAANRDRLDSIGVQKIGDRTFILHQVVGQETLFSISRRYKVPMVAIQDANDALKQGMKEGQTLLVPFGQASNSQPLEASTVVLPSIVTTDSTKTFASETSESKPAVNSDSSSLKDPMPVKVQPETDSKPKTSEPSVGSVSNSTGETKLALKTTHKIARGETLFAVAKKYNVTIPELKKWNSLSSDKVMVGQSLKILASVPVEESQTKPEPLAQATSQKEEKKEEVKKEQPKIKEKELEQPKEVKESTAQSNSSTLPGDWISHTVKSGESLFSLTQKYGTSIEDLIQWNALTSNNLKVGQSIKVGRTPVATEVPVVGEVKNQTDTNITPSKAEANVPKDEVTTPNTSGGFTNTKETGLAEVIPGTEANKKYLVLHRSAPVGSVIRVKNEENSLTIFARVVGGLPETGDNSKVLIKLSQAAFEQLKGVNARFPVEILY
jgi:LysM repeat protein